MKQKIAIILAVGILITGIILALNRQPSAPLGEVEISAGSTTYVIEGFKFERGYQDKVKTYEIEPFSEIIKDAVELNIKVDADKAENSEITTNFNICYTGSLVGSSYYTFYDMQGNVIKEKTTQLKLPTDNIDKCVVEVEAKWGRTKNYSSAKYYFIAVFDKE